MPKSKASSEKLALAKKFKKARSDSGLTQAKAAQKIGVHASYVAQLERGAISLQRAQELLDKFFEQSKETQIAVQSTTTQPESVQGSNHSHTATSAEFLDIEKELTALKITEVFLGDGKKASYCLPLDATLDDRKILALSILVNTDKVLDFNQFDYKSVLRLLTKDWSLPFDPNLGLSPN